MLRKATPSRPPRALSDTLPHNEVTGVRPSSAPAAVGGSRYTPVAALGVGGMGRVVLCHDDRVGRDVAVKVLHEDLDREPYHRARFLREARIQGQLDHPGVVPVYDIEPEGSPRFTMRYVRGTLLSEVIHGPRGDDEGARRASRRRLLTVFSSVCNAVHFAHTRGVLHRDLKPENVMLGDFGEVYVLDWGVARPMGEGRAQVEAPLASEYKTERGQVTGTPGFIAPEAWIGADLDARADVYSLGMMLFEVLTRAPYHEGKSFSELRRSAFVDARRLPSACRPDLAIPPELDAICARASALVREERYASVAELRDAVERFLDGDRDVGLRRAAADDAAAEADALAAEALSARGTDAMRADAMRRVGRALALDPDNGAAMRALVRLVLAPPRATPPEVAEALAAEWQGRVRATARVGVWAYLSWLGLLPALVWLGVRDVAVLAGVTVVMVACAAVSRWQATRADLTTRGSYVMLGASTLAVAALGSLTSPFVLTPTALVVNTMIFLGNGSRMARWAPVAAAALGMFGPAALELAGVLPRTFRFDGGALVLLPAVEGMGAGAMLAVIVAAHAVVLAAAAVAMLHTRASATRQFERLNMLLWNVKQLAPAGARGVLDRAAGRAEGPPSRPAP